MDIERLRALEKEMREYANEPVGLPRTPVDALIDGWADRLSLIAELGQEVGAVAEIGELNGTKLIVGRDEEALARLPKGTKLYASSPAHTSEARDSERLDWIERAVTEKAAVWLLPSADHRFVQVRWSRGDIDNSPTAPNLREAIDAAMRQEAGHG